MDTTQIRTLVLRESQNRGSTGTGKQTREQSSERDDRPTVSRRTRLGGAEGGPFPWPHLSGAPQLLPHTLGCGEKPRTVEHGGKETQRERQRDRERQRERERDREG